MALLLAALTKPRATQSNHVQSIFKNVTKKNGTRASALSAAQAKSLAAESEQTDQVVALLGNVAGFTTPRTHFLPDAELLAAIDGAIDADKDSSDAHPPPLSPRSAELSRRSEQAPLWQRLVANVGTLEPSLKVPEHATGMARR